MLKVASKVKDALEKGDRIEIPRVSHCVWQRVAFHPN